MTRIGTEGGGEAVGRHRLDSDFPPPAIMFIIAANDGLEVRRTLVLDDSWKCSSLEEFIHFVHGLVIGLVSRGILLDPLVQVILDLFQTLANQLDFLGDLPNL